MQQTGSGLAGDEKSITECESGGNIYYIVYLFENLIFFKNLIFLKTSYFSDRNPKNNSPSIFDYILGSWSLSWITEKKPMTTFFCTQAKQNLDWLYRYSLPIYLPRQVHCSRACVHIPGGLLIGRYTSSRHTIYTIERWKSLKKS